MTHQDVIKLLELQRAVKELPSRYGFANLADFIQALKEFHRADIGTSSSAEPATPVPSSTPEAMEAPSQPASNRSKGKRLTEVERTKVESMLRAGATTSEVVKDLGCSAATVHNIKDRIGLVKKRSKNPVAEPVT
jgi:DNA invertase Pin-like site-specific DNA recombinase